MSEVIGVISRSSGSCKTMITAVLRGWGPVLDQHHIEQRAGGKEEDHHCYDADHGGPARGVKQSLTLPAQMLRAFICLAFFRQLSAGRG
jgi:hypothetical protein